MANTRFCYKDATHIARRTCFQCAKAICTSCQIKIDHHLFCGKSCHEEYLKAIAAKTGKGYKRYAVYATLILLLGGFLYFALLADAFYSGGNRDVKPNSAQIALSLPVDMAEQPAEEIRIHHPVNGMMSPSQAIQVDGPAPHNSVVALYLNGTMMDNTAVRGGYYRFPSVRLTKHVNVIQTRFYAENGSSDSSTAVMVLYENALRAGDNKWDFFQNSSNNISRGNLKRKELAMTFNGGSEADSCAGILKTLEKADVRSTIFLSAEFIEKFPDFTRQAASRHEVGNAQQQAVSEMTRADFQNQLRRTKNLFQQVTGKQMARLWRVSDAQNIAELREWAMELGYVHVAWTVDQKTGQNMDSLDSVSNTNSPGYFPALLIKDRLLSFGQNEPEQANGSILLMHLGSERNANDRLDPWIPEMIKTFRHRGYRFVTAGELLKAS